MSERVFLTYEDALPLLGAREEIHVFMNPAGMLIGADYPRVEAIETLKSAASIEVGGEACKGMGHALVVTDRGGHHRFFEAAPAEIEALETLILGRAQV